MAKFLFPVAFVATLLVGCNPSVGFPGDDTACDTADTDADSDTDTDADSDTDADADTDTDTDTDADTDTGTDPNSVDNDGDGFTENDGDCDDADATICPTADEIYDEQDNDCDGVMDNGFVVIGVYSPADTSAALDYEAVYTLEDLGTIDGDDWEDAGGVVSVDGAGWAWWVLDSSELLAAIRFDVDMAGGNNTCEGYDSTAAIRTDIVVEFSGLSYDVVPYSMAWTDSSGNVLTGCSAISFFVE